MSNKVFIGNITGPKGPGGPEGPEGPRGLQGLPGPMNPSGGVMETFLSTKVVALVDAATISINAALGNDFYVALGASRILGAPTNPTDRQIIRVDFIQPASGGPYTITYNAIYDFGAITAPVLSTTASKIDTMAFRYVASINKWTYLGAGLGF